MQHTLSVKSITRLFINYYQRVTWDASDMLNSQRNFCRVRKFDSRRTMRKWRYPKKLRVYNKLSQHVFYLDVTPSLVSFKWRDPRPFYSRRLSVDLVQTVSGWELPIVYTCWAGYEQHTDIFGKLLTSKTLFWKNCDRHSRDKVAVFTFNEVMMCFA